LSGPIRIAHGALPQYFAVSQEMGEFEMRMIVKIAVTAAVVMAVAWPFLFWGQPANTGQSQRHYEPVEQQLIFNTMSSKDEPVW
jgi:hypothetical protein